MIKQNILTKTKSLASKVPLKIWIIGGAVLTVVISYSLIFFIPKTVEFSYAQANCVSHLTIAPDTQRLSSSDFEATFKDTLGVGNVNLLSTKVCVEPKEAPEAGTYTATIAPFGGIVASKPLTITVPEAPTIQKSGIVGKTISTAEPLKIKLSSADAIHGYELKIADKVTDCTQALAELSCEVESLQLAQGAEYVASLYRTYKDSNEKILEGQVETLQPLVMTKASIKNDQTLYDTPTEFTFTFDQAVTRADISFVKVAGDTTEPVAFTQEVNDTTLKVLFSELDREATYKVTLDQAVAENGSSLAKAIPITFETSGGPEVDSVSVGSTSVARSARIIVTFDQPLDKSVDIAKLARVEGVAGSVSKQSDTELAFAIKGGDCTAFSLIVDKGVKSASNGEVSKEPWKFNSRTICGSSWSIGNSVQGRPIIAYSFGSGSSVIMFTGGIHGSEPSSTSTMQAWAQHLQAYGNTIPAGKRVVIVPNTNPDGIAVGSRYNSRNVNIGRNFPTKNWQASIETRNGTLPTGGGTSAGSEPETAALMALTQQLRPRLEVSFHAQGRLVGANKFADSVAIGDMYANIVGYRTMFYNAEAVMGYSMTGEYEDWMGEKYNIPAILIELPSASGNYLSSQLAALKKMITL